jgi:hypothetical protein
MVRPKRPNLYRCKILARRAGIPMRSGGKNIIAYAGYIDVGCWNRIISVHWLDSYFDSGGLHSLCHIDLEHRHQHKNIIR